MKRLLAALICSTPLLAAEAEVTQQQFGKEWPFSVKEGLLACVARGPLKAVTFKANGTVYAVNGGAMTLKLGADIDRIWLPGEPVWVKDPQTGRQVNAGPRKKSIGPIIDRGLTLCPK